MSQPTPPKRHLFLHGTITTELVEKLCSSIAEINEHDDQKESNEENLIKKTYTRKPITIDINSPGGSVYAGFSLIHNITSSRTPVHTTASGVAASMGAYILLAGERRVARPFSTIMFHSLASGDHGDIEKIRRHASTMENLQNVINNWITGRSKIPVKTLRKHEQSRGDWFLSPEDALNLGVITHLDLT